MTERAYITVDRAEDPRLFEIAAPGAGGSDTLILQDLHDTASSNTLPAGDPDDSLDNLDDDFLLDSGGKQQLGGGEEVGITTTLHNAQIAFEGNYTTQQAGTATSADAPGTTLVDLSAMFLANGVRRGAVIINYTDQSVTEVLRVINETTLQHRVLKNGTNNDWGIGDAYDIFNVIQKQVTEGNIVAIDDDFPFPEGTPIDPIFPTFATQVVISRDVSAARIPGGSGLQPGDAEDLADAVWDENLAGHQIAGSTGAAMREIERGVVAEAGVVGTGSSPSIVRTSLVQPTGFFDEMDVQIIAAIGSVSRRIESFSQPNGVMVLDRALPFTPAANDVVLVRAHRSTSAEGDATACLGDGSVAVDHNYPVDGALCYTTTEGVGIDNATVRVFLASDYNANRRSNEFVVATTFTVVGGTWQMQLMLDPAEYVVQFNKQGAFGPNAVNLTVT